MKDGTCAFKTVRCDAYEQWAAYMAETETVREAEVSIVFELAVLDRADHANGSSQQQIRA